MRLAKKPRALARSLFRLGYVWGILENENWMGSCKKNLRKRWMVQFNFEVSIHRRIQICSRLPKRGACFAIFGMLFVQICVYFDISIYAYKTPKSKVKLRFVKLLFIGYGNMQMRFLQGWFSSLAIMRYIPSFFRILILFGKCTVGYPTP